MAARFISFCVLSLQSGDRIDGHCMPKKFLHVWPNSFCLQENPLKVREIPFVIEKITFAFCQGHRELFETHGAKLGIEASCERSEQKIFRSPPLDWLRMHFRAFHAVQISKFSTYEAPYTLRSWGKVPLLLPPLGGPAFWRE